MRNYLILKKKYGDRFIYCLQSILDDMDGLKYTWLHGINDTQIKEAVSKMIKLDQNLFKLTIKNI